jgi:hypothetical protein
MKKVIACLMLAALVASPVALAGEGKTCDKQKGACAEKAKSSASAKADCADKGACCAQQKVARKTANPDAKGAMFLAKR